MRLILFASLYAVSLSAVISCSPNNESEAVAPQVSVTKPKLTKGEQVLNELKSSKISYAAFLWSPKVSIPANPFRPLLQNGMGLKITGSHMRPRKLSLI